ncbi:MAG: DUF4178 domain-containing protein [Leptospira sp.]|nr:DUF4178 domain-containing protein [Leptospira sp.]
MNLEAYGKVSEIQDDHSPFQIGTSGKFGDRSFSLVGRIQLRYENGFWNEWHFIDDRNESGWLSEAQGQFMITRLLPVKDIKSIPAQSMFAESDSKKEQKSEKYYAGIIIKIDGIDWTIREISESECVSGEGELPFKFDGGYKAVLVDLANPFGRFATLDYSEDPAYFFVGDIVEFKNLSLKNLKDPEYGLSISRQPQPKSISCKSCGAPIKIKFPDFSKTVVCEYCGGVTDSSNPELAIISKFKEIKKSEIIPLGTKCKFRDNEYEVIGYMQKSVNKDGQNYPWEEWLLYNREDYLWLNCTDGHWMFFSAMKGVPMNLNTYPPSISYQGEVYRHFQSGQGVVDFAIGEFYWKVKQGDSAELNDYINPPYMLSYEGTKKEIIWAKGEYFPKEKIQEIFQLSITLPDNSGIIAPAQPNPLQRRYKRNKRLAFASVILLFVLQIGICVVARDKEVFNKDFVFSKSDAERSFVTDTFKLEGKNANVYITADAPALDNRYIYFSLALINSKTDVAMDTGIELSYYHGIDDGESWSEGSKDSSIVINEVEEGEYYLRIEPESDVPDTLRYKISLRRDDPIVWPFFVVFPLLLLPLIYSFFRYKSFESSRMETSDYAYSSSGGSDDSDDSGDDGSSSDD